MKVDRKRITGISLIRRLSKYKTNFIAGGDAVDTKQMAKIFKALSNPNRLELYLKIAQAQEADFDTSGECSIADIMSCFNIGAPTISHHIKELVNANLITTERKGKFLICKVNKQLSSEVSRILDIPY